ncbi:MAG: hypothetical protein PUH54_06470 [Oscillospiraceae bacterium]|nr:hypothetical protein [Oscillospiraceae bacterium]
MKTYNKFFFYLAWTIYLIYYIVVNDSSYKNILDYNTIDSVVKASTVLLLLVSVIFIERYSMRSVFAIIISVGIFALSSIKSDSQQILMIILFALSAKDNIKPEKFIKYDLILRTSLVLFVLLSVFLGIIDNVKVEINGYEKYSFGFNHVNIFGVLIGSIFAEFMMLFYKKIKWWHSIIFFSGLFAIYKIGVSRTSIISMGFTFLLLFLIKNKRVIKFINKHYKLVSSFPLFISFGCCFLAIIYKRSNSFLRMIDTILSTRLYWAHHFYEKYGFSLFGHKIVTISTERAKMLGIQAQIFDMGYVRLAVEYGILIFVFFLLISVLGNKYAVQSKNYGLLLASLYFSLTLIVETGGYNVINNITLILFTKELLNSNYISEKRYKRLILTENIKNRLQINLKKGKT